MSPRFPTVTGDLRLTKDWALSLPDRFARRVEDGSMVIWRPSLTFWINVWKNERGDSGEERLAWIREDASASRTEERVSREPDLIRLTYELEESDEGEKHCFRTLSGYVIADPSHLQIAAYCDDASALDIAYSVPASVRLAMPT
jgi:hypothetical protein